MPQTQKTLEIPVMSSSSEAAIVPLLLPEVTSMLQVDSEWTENVWAF